MSQRPLPPPPIPPKIPLHQRYPSEYQYHEQYPHAIPEHEQHPSFQEERPFEDKHHYYGVPFDEHGSYGEASGPAHPIQKPLPPPPRQGYGRSSVHETRAGSREERLERERTVHGHPLPPVPGHGQHEAYDRDSYSPGQTPQFEYPAYQSQPQSPQYSSQLSPSHSFRLSPGLPMPSSWNSQTHEYPPPEPPSPAESTYSWGSTPSNSTAQEYLAYARAGYMGHEQGRTQHSSSFSYTVDGRTHIGAVGAVGAPGAAPLRTHSDASWRRPPPPPPHRIAPETPGEVTQGARIDRWATTGGSSSTAGGTLGPRPSLPMSSSMAKLDLPEIPGTQKPLSSAEYKLCTEPWALSALSLWASLILPGALTRRDVDAALTGLFTHTVPTLSEREAGKMAAVVVGEFVKGGGLACVDVGSGVYRFNTKGERAEQGVVVGITGGGCYSPSCGKMVEGDYHSPGRCYSPRCSRTLNKLRAVPVAEVGLETEKDWETFYGVDSGQLIKAGVSEKEIERQSLIHELISSEVDYVADLKNVLMDLFQTELTRSVGVIPGNRLDGFVKAVFGNVRAVYELHVRVLLPRLQARQKEQGPIIGMIGDIMLDFINSARVPYLEYVPGQRTADYNVRKELAKNPRFVQWLAKIGDAHHERMKKRPLLDWLFNPVQRLMRYTLLIKTILKKTDVSSPDWDLLGSASEEADALTKFTEAKVEVVNKKLDLYRLSDELSKYEERSHLKLGESERRIIYRGELQRSRRHEMGWIDLQVILLDNYLIMAKPQKSELVTELEVNKKPIPIDLLSIEYSAQEPMRKSRLGMMGSTTVKDTSLQSPTVTTGFRRPSLKGKHTHSASTVSEESEPMVTMHRPQMVHSATVIPEKPLRKTDMAPLVTTISNKESDRTIYPFTLKHAGCNGGEFQLFAESAQARAIWVEKIRLAKEARAEMLHRYATEPFDLHILAYRLFRPLLTINGGQGSGRESILVKASRVDQAVNEAKANGTYSSSQNPPRGQQNITCATTFNAPGGVRLLALGTTNGVWLGDLAKSGKTVSNWRQCLSLPASVCQMAALEEFESFIVLHKNPGAASSLVAYKIEEFIAPLSGIAKVGQKLSTSSNDIGFFHVTLMKDRTLVIYKKRKGIESSFKMMEPVVSRAETKKKHWYGKNKNMPETFRVFDEFYVPSDCFGIHCFQKVISIRCPKGFELLGLETMSVQSLPTRDSLKDEHKFIIDGKSLGMFKQDDGFILTYEKGAVYIDKYGGIAQGRPYFRWVGRPNSVTMHDTYIIAFDSDFVEIRNAEDGLLRQIIQGRNIKWLQEETGNEKEDVMFVMEDPELRGYQIVVQLDLVRANQSGETEI
ncbi:Rho guanine nucleotide exchange factor [Saitoella coloradoensis]